VPDVLCVQEIENEQVLLDLAAQFGHGKFRYWAISGPEQSIIHTGLLSRFPILSMHSHSIMDAWGFGPLRDILEVTLDCGKAGRLSLLVCHWKSKVEGEAQTEPARRAAASLISQRVRALKEEAPDIPIIVMWDLQ